MMSINQRQTREIRSSNTYPWRGQPKPRHITYLHRRHILPLSKKETHTTQGQPSESIPAAAPGTRSPDMCFAAERCRLRRTPCRHAPTTPTPTSRIGPPSAYRSPLTRYPRGCTPSTSLRLATHGILEESRVASRRSLLVFRRGVRGAASTNARPGFQQACVCCVQSIAQACSEALHSAASTNVL